MSDVFDSLRRAIYHTLKVAWYRAFMEPGRPWRAGDPRWQLWQREASTRIKYWWLHGHRL